MKMNMVNNRIQNYAFKNGNGILTNDQLTYLKTGSCLFTHFLNNRLVLRKDNIAAPQPFFGASVLNGRRKGQWRKYNGEKHFMSAYLDFGTISFRARSQGAHLLYGRTAMNVEMYKNVQPRELESMSYRQNMMFAATHFENVMNTYLNIKMLRDLGLNFYAHDATQFIKVHRSGNKNTDKDYLDHLERTRQRLCKLSLVNTIPKVEKPLSIKNLHLMQINYEKAYDITTHKSAMVNAYKQQNSHTYITKCTYCKMLNTVYASDFIFCQKRSVVWLKNNLLINDAVKCNKFLTLTMKQALDDDYFDCGLCGSSLAYNIKPIDMQYTNSLVKEKPATIILGLEDNIDAVFSMEYEDFYERLSEDKKQSIIQHDMNIMSAFVNMAKNATCLLPTNISDNLLNAIRIKNKYVKLQLTNHIMTNCTEFVSRTNVILANLNRDTTCINVVGAIAPVRMHNVKYINSLVDNKINNEVIDNIQNILLHGLCNKIDVGKTFITILPTISSACNNTNLGDVIISFIDNMFATNDSTEVFKFYSNYKYLLIDNFININGVNYVRHILYLDEFMCASSWFASDNYMINIDVSCELPMLRTRIQRNHISIENRLSANYDSKLVELLQAFNITGTKTYEEMLDYSIRLLTTKFVFGSSTRELRLLDHLSVIACLDYAFYLTNMSKIDRQLNYLYNKYLYIISRQYINSIVNTIGPKTILSFITQYDTMGDTSMFFSGATEFKNVLERVGEFNTKYSYIGASNLISSALQSTICTHHSKKCIHTGTFKCLCCNLPSTTNICDCCIINNENNVEDIQHEKDLIDKCIKNQTIVKVSRKTEEKEKLTVKKFDKKSDEKKLEPSSMLIKTFDVDYLTNFFEEREINALLTHQPIIKDGILCSNSLLPSHFILKNLHYETITTDINKNNCVYTCIKYFYDDLSEHDFLSMIGSTYPITKNELTTFLLNYFKGYGFINKMDDIEIYTTGKVEKICVFKEHENHVEAVKILLGTDMIYHFDTDKSNSYRCINRLDQLNCIKNYINSTPLLEAFNEPVIKSEKGINVFRVVLNKYYDINIESEMAFLLNNLNSSLRPESIQCINTHSISDLTIIPDDLLKLKQYTMSNLIFDYIKNRQELECLLNTKEKVNIVKTYAKQNVVYLTPSTFSMKTGDYVALRKTNGEIIVKKVIKSKKEFMVKSDTTDFIEYYTHHNSAASLIYSMLSICMTKNDATFLKENLTNANICLGYPGAGKTYTISNINLVGTTAMVAMNGGAIQELARLYSANAMIYSNEKMSVSTKEFENIIIDECVMMKLTDVLYLNRYKCNVYLRGDANQIAAKEFTGRSIATKFNSIHTYTKKEIQWLKNVKRFGRAIFNVFNRFVPDAVLDNNTECTFTYKSICISDFNGSILPVGFENYQLLSFTRGGLRLLKTTFPILSKNISTVHSFQGNQSDNVIIFQFETNCSYGVGTQREYIISALTRARLNLMFINVYKNNPIKSIDDLLSMFVVVQDMNKGDIDLNLTVRQILGLPSNVRQNWVNLIKKIDRVEAIEIENDHTKISIKLFSLKIDLRLGLNGELIDNANLSTVNLLKNVLERKATFYLAKNNYTIDTIKSVITISTKTLHKMAVFHYLLKKLGNNCGITLIDNGFEYVINTSENHCVRASLTIKRKTVDGDLTILSVESCGIDARKKFICIDSRFTNLPIVIGILNIIKINIEDEEIVEFDEGFNITGALLQLHEFYEFVLNLTNTGTLLDMESIKFMKNSLNIKSSAMNEMMKMIDLSSIKIKLGKLQINDTKITSSLEALKILNDKTNLNINVFDVYCFKSKEYLDELCNYYKKNTEDDSIKGLEEMKLTIKHHKDIGSPVFNMYAATTAEYKDGVCEFNNRHMYITNENTDKCNNLLQIYNYNISPSPAKFVTHSGWSIELMDIFSLFTALSINQDKISCKIGNFTHMINQRNYNVKILRPDSLQQQVYFNALYTQCISNYKGNPKKYQQIIDMFNVKNTEGDTLVLGASLIRMSIEYIENQLTHFKYVVGCVHTDNEFNEIMQSDKTNVHKVYDREQHIEKFTILTEQSIEESRNIGMRVIHSFKDVKIVVLTICEKSPARCVLGTGSMNGTCILETVQLLKNKDNTLKMEKISFNVSTRVVNLLLSRAMLSDCTIDIMLSYLKTIVGSVTINNQTAAFKKNTNSVLQLNTIVGCIYLIAQTYKNGSLYSMYEYLPNNEFFKLLYHKFLLGIVLIKEQSNLEWLGDHIKIMDVNLIKKIDTICRDNMTRLQIAPPAIHIPMQFMNDECKKCQKDEELILTETIEDEVEKEENLVVKNFKIDNNKKLDELPVENILLNNESITRRKRINKNNLLLGNYAIHIEAIKINKLELIDTTILYDFINDIQDGKILSEISLLQTFNNMTLLNLSDVFSSFKINMTILTDDNTVYINSANSTTDMTYIYMQVKDSFILPNTLNTEIKIYKDVNCDVLDNLRWVNVQYSILYPLCLSKIKCNLENLQQRDISTLKTYYNEYINNDLNNISRGCMTLLNLPNISNVSWTAQENINTCSLINTTIDTANYANRLVNNAGIVVMASGTSGEWKTALVLSNVLCTLNIKHDVIGVNSVLLDYPPHPCRRTTWLKRGKFFENYYDTYLQARLVFSNRCSFYLNGGKFLKNVDKKVLIMRDVDACGCANKQAKQFDNTFTIECIPEIFNKHQVGCTCNFTSAGPFNTTKQNIGKQNVLIVISAFKEHLIKNIKLIKEFISKESINAVDIMWCGNEPSDDFKKQLKIDNIYNEYDKSILYKYEFIIGVNGTGTTMDAILHGCKSVGIPYMACHVNNLKYLKSLNLAYEITDDNKAYKNIDCKYTTNIETRLAPIINILTKRVFIIIALGSLGDVTPLYNLMLLLKSLNHIVYIITYNDNKIDDVNAITLPINSTTLNALIMQEESLNLQNMQLCANIRKNINSSIKKITDNHINSTIEYVIPSYLSSYIFHKQTNVYKYHTYVDTLKCVNVDSNEKNIISVLDYNINKHINCTCSALNIGVLKVAIKTIKENKLCIYISKAVDSVFVEKLKGINFVNKNVKEIIIVCVNKALANDVVEHLRKSINCNIKVVQECDMMTLMSTCALFMHHGGFNSVNEGILSRTFQYILPIRGDQLQNADKAHMSAIGQNLNYSKECTFDCEKAASMYITKGRFGEVEKPTMLSKLDKLININTIKNDLNVTIKDININVYSSKCVTYEVVYNPNTVMDCLTECFKYFNEYYLANEYEMSNIEKLNDRNIETIVTLSALYKINTRIILSTLDIVSLIYDLDKPVLEILIGKGSTTYSTHAIVVKTEGLTNHANDICSNYDEHDMMRLIMQQASCMLISKYTYAELNEAFANDVGVIHGYSQCINLDSFVKITNLIALRRAYCVLTIENLSKRTITCETRQASYYVCVRISENKIDFGFNFKNDDINYIHFLSSNACNGLCVITNTRWVNVKNIKSSENTILNYALNKSTQSYLFKNGKDLGTIAIINHSDINKKFYVRSIDVYLHHTVRELQLQKNHYALIDWLGESVDEVIFNSIVESYGKASGYTYIDGLIMFFITSDNLELLRFIQNSTQAKNKYIILNTLYVSNTNIVELQLILSEMCVVENNKVIMKHTKTIRDAQHNSLKELCSVIRATLPIKYSSYYQEEIDNENSHCKICEHSSRLNIIISDITATPICTLLSESINFKIAKNMSKKKNDFKENGNIEINFDVIRISRGFNQCIFIASCLSSYTISVNIKVSSSIWTKNPLYREKFVAKNKESILDNRPLTADSLIIYNSDDLIDDKISTKIFIGYDQYLNSPNSAIILSEVIEMLNDFKIEKGAVYYINSQSIEIYDFLYDIKSVSNRTIIFGVNSPLHKVNHLNNQSSLFKIMKKLTTYVSKNNNATITKKNLFEIMRNLTNLSDAIIKDTCDTLVEQNPYEINKVFKLVISKTCGQIKLLNMDIYISVETPLGGKVINENKLRFYTDSNIMKDTENTMITKEIDSMYALTFGNNDRIICDTNHAKGRIDTDFKIPYNEIELSNMTVDNCISNFNYLDEHVDSTLQNKLLAPTDDIMHIKMRITQQTAIKEAVKTYMGTNETVGTHVNIKKYNDLFNNITGRLGNTTIYNKVNKMEQNVSYEVNGMIDTYFSAEKVKNIKYMETIQFDKEATLQWLREHPNSQIKMDELYKYLEDEITTTSISDIKIFGKLESLVKWDDVVDSISSVKTRTIQAHAYFVAALFSPVFLKVKQRMKEMLHSKFMYADGCDINMLKDFLNNKKSVKYYYENDLTKQDRQTRMFNIDCEYGMYKFLGCDEKILSVFKRTHDLWKFQYDAGSGICKEQRLTGQATTAIGNAINNLLAHWEFISSNWSTMEWMLFLGDDMLCGTQSLLQTDRLKTMLKLKYNMLSKSKFDKETGNFCRLIVSYVEDKYVIVSDVIRMYNKYCAYAYFGEPTEEEIVSRKRAFLTMLGYNSSYHDLYIKNNCLEPAIKFSTNQLTMLEVTSKHYNINIHQVECYLGEFYKVLASDKIIQVTYRYLKYTKN